ncbi:predicted arginine uptake transporter [Lachnospiraceae bacterium KM106-2]|nr:predicted arginine uptake transporter [Lachnospiraceae bacterium KM106-2]
MTKKLKSFLKFFLPSLLGMILFMLPIKDGRDITIPIAVLSKYGQDMLEDHMNLILILLISFSAIGAILYKLCKKMNIGSKITDNGMMKALFEVNGLWLSLRIISAVFALIVYKESYVSAIYSSDTGGLVYHDLLPILFCIFFLAGILLPLLLNFGLLELAGTLLIGIMRPVFKLPGRSAIDAIASWLGDGTIGVLLTSKQYEEGFYTAREACVIGTNFSLVSITFSLVVINTVGLPNMFIPFYLTVTFACIIAAIVIPKLPPLSNKRDQLFNGEMVEDRDEIPKEERTVRHGLRLAMKQADSQKIVKSVFFDGMKNVLEMWIAIIPIVMAIGTIALLLAEYTPFFRVLGLPFVPFLHILGIPDAVTASGTLFAGFADMLLPSVMIASVESELTRFVIAAVSVSQLIYLSEVGALLLASKIPVKLSELFLIFIERTIIALPIIAIIAHLLF